MPGKRQARRVKLKTTGSQGLVQRKELLKKNGGRQQKLRNEKLMFKILKKRHLYRHYVLEWKMMIECHL